MSHTAAASRVFRAALGRRTVCQVRCKRGGWGLLAGSALLIGAAIGFLAPVPPKVIASVTAFGAGVLLSAVAFELIAEAQEQRLTPTALGAAAGAVAYTGCNILLARSGARHRKRSGDQQPSED